jgi:hypothetical protein
MKISKTADGKITISGEFNTFIYRNDKEEKWVTVEGFTDEEMKNITVTQFNITGDHRLKTLAEELNERFIPT